MNWKRKANAAVRELTGFQITRVAKTGPGAKPGAGPVAKGTGRAPAVAAADLVRPPADPETDRLLTAPIFILSPVRSGSTLLRAMLNAHPMLHAPHELHVRRLSVGLTTPLAARAMEALGHNQADLEHLLWDRVLHRELVRSGKAHIVDKTPANAFAHRRIATCWPDARFVFLLRHPASIATSWHEASPDRRTPHEAALDALRYMKAVERARGDLTGLTVRYEDLTAGPEAETRRICDFLGLPWEPGMLAYGEQTVVQKGLGDWKDKIRSGKVQEGRALPRAEEIPEELRPMCRTWGYLDGDESR
ncbi:sulfotransferase family protein [Streptosporangium sandarakinum]|uniref:sulfotransferase family protein n=1 Tax=Streptosporangium sandarakinum TaxID=1260955 RepID=UPI00368E0B10